MKKHPSSTKDMEGKLEGRQENLQMGLIEKRKA
jgi:hypothetical protein